MKNLSTFEKVMVWIAVIMLLFFGCVIVDQYNETKPIVAIIGWLSVVFLGIGLYFVIYIINKQRARQEQIKEYNEIRELLLVDHLLDNLLTDKKLIRNRPTIANLRHSCPGFDCSSKLCKDCPFDI